MRCALKFDKSKPFTTQTVSAWGEMQSLLEEPSYKEEDITSEKKKQFLYGYKAAMNDVCSSLETLVASEDITEEVSDTLQELMARDIAMQLFFILDHQEGKS